MVPAFGTIWLGRLESVSGVEWRVGSAAQKAPGIKESFPGFIEPALASSIDKVPGGSRWIHEIKFDGYRVQVHVQNGQVKVFTRRGNDWTKRFRKIASDASGIDAGSAILDGEVVVPSANGVSDFSVLQNALKGRSTKIVLVAFDLPYLNGHTCANCRYSRARPNSSRSSTARLSSSAIASRSMARRSRVA
jgi:ATP-dependent DNA ligase